MYIVNTTFVMTDTEAAGFTEAVKQFIPELAKESVGTPTLARVLVETEPGQRSYALQMRTPRLDSKAVEALARFASQISAEGRILHFTTPMHILLPENV